MRGLLGLVGLIVTLAIVGLLVRQQFNSTQTLLPEQQLVPSVAPTSPQIQQQLKQTVEGALQTRPLPEEP